MDKDESDERFEKAFENPVLDETFVASAAVSEGDADSRARAARGSRRAAAREIRSARRARRRAQIANSRALPVGLILIVLGLWAWQSGIGPFAPPNRHTAATSAASSLSSGSAESTQSSAPGGSVDPEAGSVPAVSSIDVCQLLTVDEITSATGMQASEGGAGQRDGVDDPVGTCLWGLKGSTNLSVQVATEAGVRAVVEEGDRYTIDEWTRAAQQRGATPVEGVGDEALLDPTGPMLLTRVGRSIMLVEIPMVSATTQTLSSIAKLAVPRLVDAAALPPPTPPARAATPATHGVSGGLLTLGECYSAWEPHLGGGTKREMTDCADQHVGELAAIIDIGDQFATYPVAADQWKAIRSLCPSAVAAYLQEHDVAPADVESVLAPLAAKGLSVQGSVASESLWSEGTTRLECVVYSDTPHAGAARSAR